MGLQVIDSSCKVGVFACAFDLWLHFFSTLLRWRTRSTRFMPSAEPAFPELRRRPKWSLRSVPDSHQEPARQLPEGLSALLRASPPECSPRAIARQKRHSPRVPSYKWRPVP